MITFLLSSTHPGGKCLLITYAFSGHCKKLTPEYIKAAATLAAQNPPQFVAKVDATEQKALGTRFGVKGFPTLMWFV